MALKRRRFAQRRKRIGHTQESLAELLGVDRTTVVRWERGVTEPQPWVRKPLAAALEVSLDELDDLLAEVVRTLDNFPSAGATVAKEIDAGGDPTDRRTFAVNAALAALGVAVPMRSWITSTDVPAQVGTDHLRMVTSTIEGFEQGDAALGGDAFCDVAMALHDRVSRWVRECAYSRATGEGLHTALGDLEAWIGWLALDAERRPTSRHYLQEAILRARLRAAQACAAARDAAGFARAFAKANTCLDRGAHEDDPLYIQFVTPLELTGIEGLSQLTFGRPERAALAFTRIVEDPDPGYRRNLGYYTLQLAQAQRRQGDIAGASEQALTAVPLINTLRSPRTQRIHATLRRDLGGYASRVPRAAEFVAAYDRAASR